MAIYFGVTSRSLPLTVDSIGNRWTQEALNRPNGYPHYHWLQTQAGCGTMEIGGETLLLREGMGVLIAPLVPHCYAPCPGGWTTSFVTFTGSMESDIRKLVGPAPLTVVESACGAYFQVWVDKEVADYEAAALEDTRLSIDCYAFLLNLTQLQERRDFLNQQLYRRYVAPVIREIETNYQQNLTVQDLCGCVYVTPQYLSRLFKRFLGCSTHTYLTHHRMNKAKELLVTHPELEIQQVAYEVGYHDVSHFIFSFKQTAGCTPLQFRQLHRF